MCFGGASRVKLRIAFLASGSSGVNLLVLDPFLDFNKLGVSIIFLFIGGLGIAGYFII